MVTSRRERLETGKEIERDFDDKGDLLYETHYRGGLSITCEYSDGEKAGEWYTYRKRHITRQTYNRVRRRYPDMPAADDSIVDLEDRIAKGFRRKVRRHQQEAKRHVPNRDAAEECDTFCRDLMKRGRRADAASWILDKNHFLGKMEWAASRRMVEKLARLGSSATYVCGLPIPERVVERSFYLVVELPKAASARAALLKEVNRALWHAGHDAAYFDDGQQFACISLRS